MPALSHVPCRLLRSGMRVDAPGLAILRQFELAIENGGSKTRGCGFARPLDVATAQSYREASRAASTHPG